MEERETGKTEEVLKTQIYEGLKDIEDIKKIVIAYEPVWAIGTGKTATAAQANETIALSVKRWAKCSVLSVQTRSVSNTAAA